MSDTEEKEEVEQSVHPFIDTELGEARIIGPVNEGMLAAFYVSLKELRPTPHKTITIYLTTEGGAAAIGLAIYDMIKAYPKDVIICASGYCYSAGMTIMQAAKVRQATKHSTILIHYGSLDIDGSFKAKEIDELQQQNRIVDSMNHKIIGGRWKGDSTALHKLLDKDVLLTAKQAKDYGLIDEVI